MEKQKDLKNIRVIILDFDGTLVEVKANWGQMRKRVGEEIEQLGLDIPIKSLALKYNQAVKTLIKEERHKDLETLREKVNKIGFEEEGIDKEKTVPVEGAKEVLEYLSAKYQLALNTSNGCNLVDFIWNKYDFPKIENKICREDVFLLKPEVEGVKKLIEKFDIPNENVVFVGDSDHDMMVANKLGLIGIWIQRLPKLRFAKPDFILQNLKEIKSIL